MQKLDGPFIAPQSGKAKELVIFLHGYGSNGDDLIGLGEQWADAMPDAAFVSPNAPEICESFSAGYQWFGIRAIDPAAFERDKSAAKVFPILSNFIDEQLEKWGVDESRLAVVGFSQGAMMAMYSVPRRKKPCAAVVGYSGMMIDAAGLLVPGIAKMPVLAVHGEEDEVVPPVNLSKIEEGFSAAGFEIETVMRPSLGHGIDQFGMMRGMQFIQESLEKAGQSSKKQVKA